MKAKTRYAYEKRIKEERIYFRLIKIEETYSADPCITQLNTLAEMYNDLMRNYEAMTETAVRYAEIIERRMK